MALYNKPFKTNVSLYFRFQDMRTLLEKVQGGESRYRSEYDRLLSEIQQYKVEIERLQREVHEQQAKDPVLTHQIKVRSQDFVLSLLTFQGHCQC